MNQKSPNKLFGRLVSLAAVAVTALSFTPQALARPYATSLTNSLTSISFRLNEDADNVKIISLGGAVTNDLGPLPKGLTVTNLVIAGTFKVQVTKASGPGFPQGVVNQISDDANNFVKFANQRGVSVNRNTNSPYFGRIYVSVSAAGTSGGRSVADGIYILNADQTDAVGQGDTPRTGGLKFDFYAANAESPGRTHVGPDDHLYLSDWSDANGGLWVVDANAATNAAATNVLFGIGGPSAETNFHGSISGIWTEGSLAAGDLVVYTQDEDLDSNNGVYRYDIGAGPLPFEGAGTRAFTYGSLAGFGQYTKILRGPDGKWYCSHRRAEQTATGNQSAGVFVLSEDGTPLWNSLTAWQEIGGVPSNHDVIFGETRGFDVSPDGKYLVGFRASARTVAPTYAANTVIVVRLQDGVPDLNTVVLMPTTPTLAIGRDLTFDAAGNIYTVSSGQGVLRVYSPGGFSVATTGSDGTFDLYVPDVDLSVAATQEIAGEPNINGEYTITRASIDISQPLAVYFTMSGSAVQGSDYVLRTNSVALTTNVVVIPANENNVVVALVTTEDSVAELTETARLGLTPDAAYTVLSQPATVTIDDNEAPSIDIATVQGTVFEANPFDYARFQLTRRGRTNDGPLSVEIHNGGDTARYVAAGPINIDAGVVNQTFDVNPANDSLLNGSGTISLTVSNGTGYTVGVITPTAAANIVDDEVPAAPILFADDFSGDPSTNWIVRFASGNGVDDYRINDQIITFPTTAYDYSIEGIPPAPNGSDTLGLKLTVNKDEGSALGAAGINLYPVGRSFSGDYALRFDMYTILNANVATTEQVLFGINHSGNQTNWFRSGLNGYTNSTYDGLWSVMVSDSSGLGTYNGNAPSGDYILVSAPQTNRAGIWGPTVLANRDADSFVDTFKNPPWGVAGLPGVPSNPNVTDTRSWAQVELSQIGNLVTLKINNTVIFSVPNNGPFQSGNIMLGYSDSFDSVGNVGSVIYDNVRVVGLTQPELTITSAERSGTTTVLNFTWTTDDPVSAFTVWKATNVTGTYNTVAATIVKLSPGVYQATLTGQTDSAAFYRISR